MPARRAPVGRAYGRAEVAVQRASADGGDPRRGFRDRGAGRARVACRAGNEHASRRSTEGTDRHRVSEAHIRIGEVHSTAPHIHGRAMERSRGNSYRLRLLFAVLLFELVSAAAAITRDDFPEGFVFGAGSSAYQVEGAWAEDGKKPSIWDTYTQQGYAMGHTTADVAADQYHKYKAYVRFMHEMGLDAYRFSISWPRLIPDGRGAVNPKGLEYYNNLIDELLKHGIQPHTTIYHFDLPQALQDEYNGLLSPRVIEDFTAFADVCFRSFGDRVKHWTTVNEPNMEPLGGYDMGTLPPRRCSSPFGFPGNTCAEGNSTTEPYVVAHHLLLAHASMVSLYRRKYQAVQGGRIGLTLLARWYEPATTKLEDVAAAERMNDFTLGCARLIGNYVFFR
ncbi:hypothetical protein ACQ4PT_017006 [Festuca glaucescens]